MKIATIVNKLRQDPIFKLVCNQVPTVGENLLASQLPLFIDEFF